MVRHISLFCFQEHPENGKTLEENIADMKAFLLKIPEMEPTILHGEVGHAFDSARFTPDDAPVMFGQLVQIIDFATWEDAAAYVPSKAHTELAQFSAPFLKKVIAIDYEI
ncbi:MAG: Stress responsive Barrel Domain [Oscillospiraceae bacterium]|nr:Stress responsive Barrel Domain [Oscillospiraceae bacterium]